MGIINSRIYPNGYTSRLKRRIFFMGNFIVVLLIVATIINRKIWHKMFAVTYFGVGGIFKELLGCFLMASIEITFIYAIIRYLFG